MTDYDICTEIELYKQLDEQRGRTVSGRVPKYWGCSDLEKRLREITKSHAFICDFIIIECGKERTCNQCKARNELLAIADACKTKEVV